MDITTVVTKNRIPMDALLDKRRRVIVDCITPGIAEAIWLGLDRHGLLLKISIIAGLEFGWRHTAQRFHSPMAVEPGHPHQGCRRSNVGGAGEAEQERNRIEVAAHASIHQHRSDGQADESLLNTADSSATTAINTPSKVAGVTGNADRRTVIQS